jgi:hypothetical protein
MIQRVEEDLPHILEFACRFTYEFVDSDPKLGLLVDVKLNN